MALTAAEIRAIELEGREACFITTTRDECPYSSGTEEYDAWQDGWDDAWTDVTESSFG